MKQNHKLPFDHQNEYKFKLNTKQKKFVLYYYPKNSGAPYDMMCWIYVRAKMSEDADGLREF